MWSSYWSMLCNHADKLCVQPAPRNCWSILRIKVILYNNPSHQYSTCSMAVQPMYSWHKVNEYKLLRTNTKCYLQVQAINYENKLLPNKYKNVTYEYKQQRTVVKCLWRYKVLPTTTECYIQIQTLIYKYQMLHSNILIRISYFLESSCSTSPEQQNISILQRNNAGCSFT